MSTSSDNDKEHAPAPGQNSVVAVVGRMSGVCSSILHYAKPWGEILDRSAMSKPQSASEAAGRIRKNLTYFKVNYLILVVLMCMTSFLMHPASIFVLGLLMACWVYLLFVRTLPVVINGRLITDREKVYGMSAISFVVVFFLTSVGAVLFSALGLSMVVIAVHGAFREPDNLFLDDGETTPSLFSMMPGGHMPAVAELNSMV